MSKVHAQATCRLSMIPAKTSMLAGHFVYNSSSLGNSTPPGANVIQTAFVNNTDVTSLPAQWESNVHIGANGIQLRYNEIVLSEWVAKKITKNGVNIDPNFTFYYPKEDANTGIVSQGLSALKLSAGGMLLYRDSDNNEDENVRKLFDLGSSGLIFYSGGTSSVPIARFNGSGVQIGKDGVVNAYVTSNSFVLRNENVNPTRTFFKVKDGLVEEGTYTDSFIGDGIKVKFDLSYDADSSTYTVKKNNIEVGSSEIKKTTSYFTFNIAPLKGDVITATYNVTRPSKSSCTFGIRKANSVEGDYSVAEGHNTTASGNCSHAEGYNTTASGPYSHAEGEYTFAIGNFSHAEGAGTEARGSYSHAEGYGTKAIDFCSHASGSHTQTSGLYQTVMGMYNDDVSAALLIIGNGTSDNARSHAFAVKSTGDVDIKGDVNIARNMQYKINGTALSASDVGALATSGGNITGNLSYKSSTIDASLANNNVSSTQYPTTFNILDKSNRILTRIEGIIESNGNIGSYWYVRNYNTSGTQVAQKGIKMTMDKSGNLTYTIQDTANFRTALGLGSLATKNSLSASDVGAVPTSRTVNGKALSGNIALSAGDVGAVAKSICCYANSRVDTFSSGSITLSLSTLGITNGAKPVGILLTHQDGGASPTILRYDYDASSASGVVIRAYDSSGGAVSGAVRYFAMVFQGSWTTS